MFQHGSEYHASAHLAVLCPPEKEKETAGVLCSTSHEIQIPPIPSHVGDFISWKASSLIILKLSFWQQQQQKADFQNIKLVFSKGMWKMIIIFLFSAVSYTNKYTPEYISVSCPAQRSGGKLSTSETLDLIHHCPRYRIGFLYEFPRSNKLGFFYARF